MEGLCRLEGISRMPMTQIVLMILGILMKVVRAEVAESIVDNKGGITILGKHFTRMEILLYTLRILIIIRFIAAAGAAAGEKSEAGWPCFGVGCALCVPYLYLSYRLNKFQWLTKFFGCTKGMPQST